jgi:Flp pilus assembly protein TadG
MTMWNRLTARLRVAGSDERGAVAMQFALLLLPIAILTFGLIDISQVSVQKRQLQDALDAATLMAARSNANTDTALAAIGRPALAAEMPGSAFTEDNSNFTGAASTTIVGTASVKVSPIVANLWTKEPWITVNARSEVKRATNDIEVALVLDTTGSMAGQKITDLKAAANELIKIVVKDNQTPFYSKVAIVPYSMGVNVGTAYADQVRGPVSPPKTITGATWKQGTDKTITGASRASTAVITAAGHGFPNGARVYITGVKGMTSLNNKIYTVAGATTNTFQLSGVNSSGYTSYSSGGTVTRCQTSTCSVVVTTATAHDFITSDIVVIAGVGGMTELNSKFTVSVLSTTTFDTGAVGTGYGTYTSGGTATCDTSTNPGCTNFTFTNANSKPRTLAISTCVTERNGINAYTDVAPSTTYLGRNYPASTNPCPKANEIVPLSSDRTVLAAKVNALTAGGSTGGHVGVGWGWYMVSPNFGYLWPSQSRPAAYAKKDLLKVVVLMTDGEYNSAYCKGVISQDSTSGSGDTNDHINCDAPNGGAFAQATALCDAMKLPANGQVIVYTVGFNVVNDQRAKDLVNNCATDAKHVYLPSTGTALKDAFAAIGRDITTVRISQ